MSAIIASEASKTLRVAVVSGTKENDFAKLLETEFHRLGVETGGSLDGDPWKENEMAPFDSGVFIVDQDFAKTWGKLTPQAFKNHPLANLVKRFWISDINDALMARKLQNELDPSSSFVPLSGTYNQQEAMWAAGQILGQMGASIPASPSRKPSPTPRATKISPAPGSARTRTPEEKANEERSAHEEHLRSGNATLSDLIQSSLIGSALTDADDRAFRLGAAMSATRNEPLISAGVFVGYLLTGQDGEPQDVLATAVWLEYVNAKGINKVSDRPDFWNALNLEERKHDVEILATDTSATDNIKISPKLAAILLRTIAFARDAGPGQSFSTRHLLTCLIGRSGQQLDDSAVRMLHVLKVDVRRVCRIFRDWLAINHSRDRAAIIDNELGVTALASQGAWSSRRQRSPAIITDESGDVLLTENGQTITTEEVPIPGEVSKSEDILTTVADWRDGVAGIATGAVQFEDDRDVEDALKIEAYATRFARVIALRATEMPISVALFGKWGSGKTYFMKLLQQEIRKLSDKREENSWCTSVVPIRFNAWHYIDSNLWASLVSEIFDQLFDYLAGSDRGATKRLMAAERLMKQIEGAKGAISEIKEEIKALEVEKEQVQGEILVIERRLRMAERSAKHRTDVASNKLDNLQVLVPALLNDPKCRQALKALGLENAATSYKDFAMRIGELRSLTGRVRALGGTIADGWWGAISLLILLALLWLAPVMIGWLTLHVLATDGSLRTVMMAIGSGSGLLMGVTTWLGVQAARAGNLLTIAENVQKAARKARAEKENTPELRRLRQKAEYFSKKKDAAADELKAARAKVRQLEEELREQRPERRLYRFIEERAGAEDYRQHLGLVSLVRRDFRELSRLFTEKSNGKTAWGRLLGPAEKTVDRIVLYVDDLDRCQPQRVVEVLEAVHLLLDFPLFVAVVAVDPRWVKQSLRVHYSKLLNGGGKRLIEAGSAQLEGALGDEEQDATPLDYLEKIFHIPFQLPGMKEDGFKNLIRKLAGNTDSAKSILNADNSNAGEKNENLVAEEIHRQTSTRQPGDQEGQNNRKSSPQGTGVNEGDSLTVQAGEGVIGIVKLDDWEVERMSDYAALIRTPRAAKRFLNTYRLVRAGLRQEDWNEFRGDKSLSGEFRVAMLLLGAAAGSPALARDWFNILRAADPTALALSDDDEYVKHSEWIQFKRVYVATFAQTNVNFSRSLFIKWMDRVERFTF